MLAKRFPYAVDCLSTAHRQTLVWGFVVACAVTFGMLVPKRTNSGTKPKNSPSSDTFCHPNGNQNPMSKRFSIDGLTGSG